MLPSLLEKTRAREWRAVVVSPDAARLEDLDDWLWTYRDDSFLAHGRADADRPAPERQPILLAASAEEQRNTPQLMILLDGAEPPQDAHGLERCLVMFDSASAAHMEAARALWKTVAKSGAQASYWVQGEAGGWKRER